MGLLFPSFGPMGHGRGLSLNVLDRVGERKLFDKLEVLVSLSSRAPDSNWDSPHPSSHTITHPRQFLISYKCKISLSLPTSRAIGDQSSHYFHAIRQAL